MENIDSMFKAFMFVSVENPFQLEVIREAGRIKGIVGAYNVSGIYDVAFEVATTSRSDFRYRIKNAIRNLNYVYETLALEVKGLKSIQK